MSPRGLFRSPPQQQPQTRNNEPPRGLDYALQLLAEHGRAAAVSIPVVRRCLIYIADRLAALPVHATGRRPPWLDSPNPDTDRRSFVSQFVTAVTLWPEAYILVEPTTTGRVGALHIPDPDMVSRPRVNDAPWLYNGVEWPGPVVHTTRLALPAALGCRNSVSATGALTQQMRTARGASTALAREFDSGTNFDIIVSATNAADRETMNDLLDELEAEAGSGYGLTQPIVTAADVKISRLTPSIRDRKLSELSIESQAQIATLGFGISADIVGLFVPNQSNTYRNLQEHSARTWRDTVRGYAQACETVWQAVARQWEPAAGTITIDPTEEHRGTPADRAAIVRVMTDANRADDAGRMPRTFGPTEVREVLGLARTPGSTGKA